MCTDILGEHFQGAVDQLQGPVRVVAGTPAADQAAQPLQFSDKLRIVVTTGNRSQDLGHGRQAEHARAALLGGLPRQVLNDPGGGLQPALPGGKHMEDASARADGLARRARRCQPAVHRLYPAPVVATHQDRLHT